MLRTDCRDQVPKQGDQLVGYYNNSNARWVLVFSSVQLFSLVQLFVTP